MCSEVEQNPRRYQWKGFLYGILSTGACTHNAVYSICPLTICTSPITLFVLWSADKFLPFCFTTSFSPITFPRFRADVFFKIININIIIIISHSILFPSIKSHCLFWWIFSDLLHRIFMRNELYATISSSLNSSFYVIAHFLFGWFFSFIFKFK